MSDEERAEMANKLKAEGTQAFQEHAYATAALKYELAGDYAVAEGIDGENVPENERPLYVSCWLNAAMCHIKLKEWTEAIAACNRLLEIEEELDNLKALYRRGLARMKVGLLKEAKIDLMDAYNVDNANKDVRRALAELKKTMADAKAKEKKAFGNLFKQNLYDDKEGPLIPNANGDNPHVFCK